MYAALVMYLTQHSTHQRHKFTQQKMHRTSYYEKNKIKNDVEIINIILTALFSNSLIFFSKYNTTDLTNMTTAIINDPNAAVPI
jgi:hypothetical protein